MTSVHADFGEGLWEGGPIGIPYLTVLETQPRVTVSFEYDDETISALIPFNQFKIMRFGTRNRTPFMRTK